MATLLEKAWKEGNDSSLEALILQLVDPPIDKIGVFPVEQFYPSKARMALAMELNGLLASPSFEDFRKGAALDIDALLAKRQSDDGVTTPVNIFNIAHLSEPERQFFTSLLLSKIR